MKLELYSTPLGIFIIKDEKLYKLFIQSSFKDGKDVREWKWEKIELPNGDRIPKESSK